MKPSNSPLLLTGLALLVAALAASCKVGPDYKRPELNMPATYRSATTQEVASPRLEQNWWRLFNDPDLSAMEDMAMRANTDLAAAMARVEEARAATQGVKSQFYPTLALNPSATRARTSANGPNGTAKTGNLFLLPFDLSYEVDIWGRVKRSYEASQAQTQATVDDFAVVRQTVAADVASNYMLLRSLDSQQQILDANVTLYRQQLALTQTRHQVGLAGPTDVLQAQTLLDATIAQQVDNRRQRVDLEHALAVLLGRAPAEWRLWPRPLNLKVPAVPAGLPSELLRRRPDVAEAEQNLVAASAQIGVAQAAFYPNVQLTGMAGFESIDLRHTLDWQSRVWSIGPNASIPIFEGGQLEAGLAQAKARYAELLASYRGTILTAFREVEDALTDLHLRADEQVAQDRAVAYAREYLRLTEIQYKQGLTDYLQVIIADRTLLNNELAAVQIDSQRLVASVVLMKALGGGWDPALPPSTRPAAATQPARE